MTRTINRNWRLFLVLFILSLALSAIAADFLPDAEDINDLSQKAKQVSDSFFSQTFTIRMQFEYSGRFLNQQDKDSFCKAAQQTSAELEHIANDQNNLKYKIENYQDDDWESRFGQTGLWRKLAADLLKTQTSKLEIDSYSAIAGGEKTECPHFAVHSRCASIKAPMEKIRCFGPSQPNELGDLVKTLAQSECKDDPETLLLLAILQNKYAPDMLQNTLSRSPQTTYLLGKIVLADISSDANLNSLNPVAADLAAVTAWRTNPQPYAGIIDKLADNEKFQTPAVLYVAATLYQQTQPEKAVGLLIKASNLQLKNANALLNKTADQIAGQAFQTSYQQFEKSFTDCQPAIDAYENYSRIAPDKIDQQSRFMYADLLNHCNMTSEAADVFNRLAEDPNSAWRDAANLELLKIKLSSSVTPAQSNEVLAKLRDFILDCSQPDEKATRLRLVAMDIYCTKLLYQDSNDSAEKILYILDKAPPAPGLGDKFFRAAALKQLDRLEESAHFMSKALDDIDSSRADCLFSLLSEILDKIELWQQKAGDFNQMLLDCNTLAEFVYKIPKSQKTILPIAEVCILRSDLDRAEYLLNTLTDENDVGRLRPKARLLMAQNKFEQSAVLWAKIAELRRNETADQNKKSYGWWQAKFYELYCLAKTPQPNKQNIHHAIEVLQNSHADIPSPWPEKLNGLREMCSN